MLKRATATCKMFNSLNMEEFKKAKGAAFYKRRLLVLIRNKSVYIKSSKIISTSWSNSDTNHQNANYEEMQ